MIDFGELESAFGSGYRFGGGATLSRFFNLGIINIVFFVAGAIFLFFIITSGLTMMTSAGNPKAIEGAKARLTQALLGFVIIFAAYWIVQIVGSLLGLSNFGGVFSEEGTFICTNCVCPALGNQMCSGVCTTSGCNPGF